MKSQPAARFRLAIMSAALGMILLAGGANAAPGPTSQPRSIHYGPAAQEARPADKDYGEGHRGGSIDGLPSFVVVAPYHPARTISPQPTLWWFLSADTPVGIRTYLTLNRAGDDAPTLQRKFDSPMEAGYHRISLAAEGKSLDVGVQYEFVVSLVQFDRPSSSDAVASAFITLEEVAPPLAERLAAAGWEGRPYVLAEEGIWYDAVSELFEQLAEHPEDSALRKVLESLLSQAQLPDAAGQVTRARSSLYAPDWDDKHEDKGVPTSGKSYWTAKQRVEVFRELEKMLDSLNCQWRHPVQADDIDVVEVWPPIPEKPTSPRSWAAAYVFELQSQANKPGTSITLKKKLYTCGDNEKTWSARPEDQNVDVSLNSAAKVHEWVIRYLTAAGGGGSP